MCVYRGKKQVIQLSQASIYIASPSSPSCKVISKDYMGVIEDQKLCISCVIALSIALCWITLRLMNCNAQNYTGLIIPP